MSYGEALRLTGILLRDPSSQVAAAREGWDGPRSREWFVLADLFDLTYRAHVKDPPPYPRPGGRQHDGIRRGKTNMTRAAVIAVLNAHGHSIPQEASSG